MPPIRAAPAMKWSQSDSSSVIRSTSRASPSTKLVVGVVVVGLGHLAVLGEVVDADDGVAAGQQLLDHVAADEAGRAADQDLLT